MDRSGQWLRSPRIARAVDVAAVTLVALVGLVGHAAARSNARVEAAPLTPVFAVLAMAVAALLWWRRTRPAVALLVLVGLTIVGGVVHDPGLFSAQLALAVAGLVYAAASWSERRRGATTVVVVLAALFGLVASGSGFVAAIAYTLTLFGLPFAAGYAARTRRSYLEEVERRLREVERDRDERARRAVAEERNRIARELHDVVAHHVSLIGVQAGAARTALDRSPDQTRAALTAIESSSRTAVGEMRQLLDVLDVPGDAPRAPQPGLPDLDALVARVRAAGYDVELCITGDPGRVPELVGLAAYRITEEALTNVTRHSCAHVARVDVTIGGDACVVAIRDPGPSRAVATETGSGRGLAGMRQRVALFGGRVEVGPFAGAGFGVVARLPIPAS